MSFLSQIEVTIGKVFTKYGGDGDDILKNLLPNEREAYRVAQRLRDSLNDIKKRNLCPTCWLPLDNPPSCCCDRCPPVQFNKPPTTDNSSDSFEERQTSTGGTSSSSSSFNRLFLIMHHNEIGMSVDTAKLILAALPNHCRLIVAGIGSEFQDSMAELEEALKSKQRRCLVLFPDDDSKTFDDIVNDHKNGDDIQCDIGWDVVVIDGTWSQARRIKNRYFPSSKKSGGSSTAIMAKLSDDAMATLEQEFLVNEDNENVERNPGHQLRKHSITARKVGTFEAARLFLADVLKNEYCDDYQNIDDQAIPPPWIQMKDFQRIANAAFEENLKLAR